MLVKPLPILFSWLSRSIEENMTRYWWQLRDCPVGEKHTKDGTSIKFSHFTPIEERVSNMSAQYFDAGTGQRYLSALQYLAPA